MCFNPIEYNAVAQCSSFSDVNFLTRQKIKHASYELNELGSALRQATRLMNELASVSLSARSQTATTSQYRVKSLRRCLRRNATRAREKSRKVQKGSTTSWTRTKMKRSRCQLTQMTDISGGNRSASLLLTLCSWGWYMTCSQRGSLAL